MNNGWSIGPDIAELGLSAVAGLPVVWPLTPLPDNWTPFDPEFNIFLQNDTIVSFKLVYGPLGSEEGWYVALSGEQTKTLETATYVQLVDTGFIVAAGRYTNLTGWSPNISPVTMPVRVVGAPSAGNAVSDHGDLEGLGDDDHDQYALSDGSRGNFAAPSHDHTLDDITDYTEPDLSNLVETTDGRLSDSRTPTAHNHPISGVTGLQAELNEKQPSGSYAPTAHDHTLNDITDYAAPDLSGLVTTTDPRLTDSRTPTAHNHPISGVTGLQAELDGKQAAGSYAPASHNHTAAQITGIDGAGWLISSVPNLAIPLLDGGYTAVALPTYIVWVPFYLCAMSINSARFYVSTAGTSGAISSLALYSVGLLNDPPMTHQDLDLQLVSILGNVPVDAVGEAVLNFAPVSIPAGMYFVGIRASVAGVVAYGQVVGSRVRIATTPNSGNNVATWIFTNWGSGFTQNPSFGVSAISVPRIALNFSRP